MKFLEYFENDVVDALEERLDRYIDLKDFQRADRETKLAYLKSPGCDGEKIAVEMAMEYPEYFVDMMKELGLTSSEMINDISRLKNSWGENVEDVVQNAICVSVYDAARV